MEIIPGVYQLKIPVPDNPLGYLNSYLIRGDKGYLLVDTGWNTEEAFRCLEDQLKGLGLWFTDLELTIITHVHPDHYGLVGRIKQNSSCRFAFHVWEKALIESRYIDFTGLQARIGQFLCDNGVPKEIASPLERASLPALDFVSVAWPDEILYGGELFTVGEFQLEALWTPGHAPGHVCLYEPSRRLLFSGDHILPTITPNISYHVQSGNNPLGEYLGSLRQLRRLPVDLVLPAHEDVFQDLGGRVDAILRHHEQRQREIIAVLSEGHEDAYSIAQQLPWNIPGNQWQSLDALNRRIAVMETIAHLESLRMDGLIKRFRANGIFLYEAMQSDG